MAEHLFPIPGEEIKEKVLIYTRPHFVSFLDSLAILTVSFILPFIFIPFWFSGIAIQLVVLLLCVYYLVWLDIAFIEWVKFYYTMLVVTERHLIVTRQKNVFNRKILQCHLNQLQESTAHVHGFLANMFHYGSIELQTGGPHEQIIIDNIPNPFEISERIMKLHDEVAGKK